MANAWYEVLADAWWEGVIFGSKKLCDFKREQDEEGVVAYEKLFNARNKTAEKDACPACCVFFSF